MRLALVTHKFARGDGQGRVNYEIARAALEAGHDVWLVGSEIAPELCGEPRAHAVHIDVARWPSALVRNQVFAINSARWLARMRRRLDVVHVNGFTTWSRADVNTSHFVHDAWLRSPYHTSRLRHSAYAIYQFLYTWSGARLEYWAYRRSRLIIAVSNQVARELAASGVPARRVRVIGNGVDLEEFGPGTVSRSALDLPEGPLLLFVGELRTPRKNLDTVLRALALTAAPRLVVVGDVRGSRYPALAAQLGLADRVRFLGYRRDVAELMRAVDVFVFPSRYEACSLVLLEAAASGLPIVAARTTGGTELLNHECSVLLDDTEDAERLAAVLEDLASRPPVRARMSAAARAVAESNSWRTMAGRYLQVYEALCERDELPRVCDLGEGSAP